MVVLIYGLSDFLFFMCEIVNIFYDEGFDVLVLLFSGYGLCDVSDDMFDSDLVECW